MTSPVPRSQSFNQCLPWESTTGSLAENPAEDLATWTDSAAPIMRPPVSGSAKEWRRVEQSRATLGQTEYSSAISFACQGASGQIDWSERLSMYLYKSRKSSNLSGSLPYQYS